MARPPWSEHPSPVGYTPSVPFPGTAANWPVRRPAKLSLGHAHQRWKEIRMKIAVTYGDALAHETPLLALGAWEGESLPRSIASLTEDGDWSGKFKQTTVLYPRGSVPARRVLLIGLGKRGQITFDRLCEAAAVAAQSARDLRVDQFAFDLPTP